MSFDEKYVQDVVGYMRQMRALRSNHWALYYPEPSNGKEIEIGDVGYVFEGSFRRLFNATVDRAHDFNRDSAPAGHTPIPFDESTDVIVYGESKIILPNTPCCSDRIKWEASSSESQTYALLHVRYDPLTKT